jgi:hypothetical protein
MKVSESQKAPEDLIDKVFGTIAGTDVTQFALGISEKAFFR